MLKKKLSKKDQYLTLWILTAMVFGVLLSLIPGIKELHKSVTVGTTSIPIAIGLILMMYPPLAKVEYEKIPQILKQNKKLLLFSIFQNWILGPFLMYFFACMTLYDQPELMEGVILIGLANCIAMVIVWNDLARGNRELAASLVALNSLFQLTLFSVYAFFFMQVLPKAMGLPSSSEKGIPMSDVAISVAIYLGIPFFGGLFTRLIFVKLKKMDSYRKYISRISPLTLIFLLFTIIAMFSLKGEDVIRIPLLTLRVAVPLLLFFVVLFFFSFWFCKKFLKSDYPYAVSISFTAASNNFELAIATAIGVFGIESNQSFAATIGPLVEVPVMLLLVHAAFWLERKWYKPPKQIMIVCRENKCRSQILQAWIEYFVEDDPNLNLICCSSGSHVKKETNPHPLAVMVMKEEGINMKNMRTCNMKKYEKVTFDIVILVCNDEACPCITNSKKVINKPFPDPGMSEDLEDFRKIRDMLRDYAIELISGWKKEGFGTIKDQNSDDSDEENIKLMEKDDLDDKSQDEFKTIDINNKNNESESESDKPKDIKDNEVDDDDDDEEEKEKEKEKSDSNSD
ncbi:arsenite efflux transporter [Anaeramoeba flamelloides]|uniref:Arsenite efflux transporter n=1 Tax=Anaeramoeba flamelloides TaxID=1746091 RepID=A0AAV7ZK36_9EUKA|nr:arsenite efflux transporter [Anaeramoeba flamelloides]